MDKSIINISLDILGDKAMVIAMEELAELQQAISKGLRGKLDYENLCEEIADTLIVLEWIKNMYDIKERDIQTWEETKLIRIKNRIKNNELS